MSFTRNIQHITFATKSRRPTIAEKHRRDLYRMLWDTLTKLEVHTFRIGGVGNHVHILCDIPSKWSIADVLQRVKGGSSRWMKQCGLFPKFYGWADEYYSHSCCAEEIPVITEYIKNQEEHHKTMSWKEEMREFIRRAGGDPDMLDKLEDFPDPESPDDAPEE